MSRTINLRAGEIIRICYRGTDALLVSVAMCAPYTGRIAIGQMAHPAGYVSDHATSIELARAVYADGAERTASAQQ